MKHQLLCSLGAFLGVFVAWGTYLSVQQNAYIHSLRDVDESFVMGAQLSHLLIAAAFMTGIFKKASLDLHNRFVSCSKVRRCFQVRVHLYRENYE